MTAKGKTTATESPDEQARPPADDQRQPASTTKAQQRTDPVANSRNPGVEDLDSLKKEAIELMAESLGQEAEYDGLVARQEELEQRLEEARDSAAVLRLRAGGRFREVREILKPTKGEWTKWKKEIKQSRGWSSTTIDEAIDLHDLANGDEAKVKGMKISHALELLRNQQERDEREAAERSARAKKSAETRRRNKERNEAASGPAAVPPSPPDGGPSVPPAGPEAVEHPGPQPQHQLDAPRVTQLPADVAALLAEQLGPAFDPAGLEADDLARLAAMAASLPSPGLARLKAAWQEATEEEREAFLLWVREGGS